MADTRDDASVEEKTDWQAKYEDMRRHSREWEKKAKENATAAEELEKLRHEKLTDQEKAEKRAAKAEKELSELRAERQRSVDAKEVSEATGVPMTLLMYCADRESMESFAKEYEGAAPAPAAPPAPSSRLVPNDGGAAPGTTRDQFAELAQVMFT